MYRYTYIYHSYIKSTLPAERKYKMRTSVLVTTDWYIVEQLRDIIKDEHISLSSKLTELMQDYIDRKKESSPTLDEFLEGDTDAFFDNFVRALERAMKATEKSVKGNMALVDLLSKYIAKAHDRQRDIFRRDKGALRKLREQKTRKRCPSCLSYCDVDRSICPSCDCVLDEELDAL